MENCDNSGKENASAALNVISKLVHDIESRVLEGNVKAKECEELRLLKEKCCDKNAIVSLSAFHGIASLVERRILTDSQTVLLLISLLPSINQHPAWVSTVGKILLHQLQREVSETGAYSGPYCMEIQHPFIMILKSSSEKSWFEIYSFIQQLIQMNDDIKIEHKIKFLQPIVRQVFWDSQWGGSKFQMKLFNALLMQLHQKEFLHFTLEALLWQPLDIYHCMYLQEIFLYLLSKRCPDDKAVVCGLAPALAHAIKWLIVNGHDPTAWLKLLSTCYDIDRASGSTILYILTDVIMETPSSYINMLVHVCKSIIISACCSEYVAYKFIAVVLNWFVNPSFLANPLYQALEEIIEFITGSVRKWNDQTSVLNANEYYQTFGRSRTEVKFVVELILTSNGWNEGKISVADWLRNLSDSNERQMQLRLHSFIQGIILCERDNVVVNLCLDLLYKLIEADKQISFSHLCLLFYKLGREQDPTMQKNFLLFLPKLAVQKENIPLIIGIIESLKRGSPKIMTPLVLQLYLSLWKQDRRTYSYLHSMLHDSTPSDFAWELNVSKAIALKEICRLAPHLHAKDLVGVLSKILNECSGSVSGLPSAIAIEAVTELCKAYVIDVAGTWAAIQPKLRLDKRPQVIKSLCKFFGEIPSLNSSEQNCEDLTKDIVPMLWKYTFFSEEEVVRDAFRALSKFPLENLPLRLFPEVYRTDIKLPKDLEKNSKTPEDVLNLPYVAPECWIQFLSKINETVLQDGGDLIITLLERELTSLPRGVFYLPAEKPEPLNYSYLPPGSISRTLVDHLQKQQPTPSSPRYLKQIVSVLAHNYSKTLPPLNWRFLEKFMPLDSDFLRHCLTLLAKQGQLSSSAKAMLDSYFKSAKWDSRNLDQALFVYNLLPQLCKAVSSYVLQNFFELTLHLALDATLHQHTTHFHQLSLVLSDALGSKLLHSDHKALIARQLQQLLPSIPPHHEAMNSFVVCATDFPIKSIEQVTSVRDLSQVTGEWIRRAVGIRRAIAMRPDIKDPLFWLNELTEAAAHFPEETNFVVETTWLVTRGRRDCDHRNWLQELTWRVQAAMSTSGVQESREVTLFLLDIFVTATITLSGYDCLFASGSDLTVEEAKKLDVFPQALSTLLSFPAWSDMLPKVGSWLQKLLKWRDLPKERARAFVEALFCLRETKGNEESPCFLGLYRVFAR